VTSSMYMIGYATFSFRSFTLYSTTSIMFLHVVQYLRIYMTSSDFS
jgi:hypothetical protein